MYCKAKCGFYASESGYCSQCVKIKMTNSEEADKKDLSRSDESKLENVCQNIQVNQVQTKKNRCYHCGKKVPLTAQTCKCGHVFCDMHHFFKNHDCLFDYKKEGETSLHKCNPVVTSEKVTKI